MNGGIAVDTWGRSSLSGLYAIGEAVGAHGVTRPGGAALNAGQVPGTRAAEQIAAVGWAANALRGFVLAELDQAVARTEAVLRPGNSRKMRAIKDAVQAPMSDHAGRLCIHPNRSLDEAEKPFFQCDFGRFRC